VEWTVDFYQEVDGSAPVEEFLDSLRTEGRAKALALVQALKIHGPNLPFPYSSQAAGKIRELRTQYGRDKIRILYFADARRIFILLHGFVKRTAKLEPSELAKAENRMARHNQGINKRGENIVNRFDRYYRTQMEDSAMRERVEEELASLEIGVQIANLRAKHRLNQTQLAARAGMSAPKVSRIESAPANVQLDTLIRLAQALGARLEVRLVEEKGKSRRSRRARAGA